MADQKSSVTLSLEGLKGLDIRLEQIKSLEGSFGIHEIYSWEHEKALRLERGIDGRQISRPFFSLTLQQAPKLIGTTLKKQLMNKILSPKGKASKAKLGGQQVMKQVAMTMAKAMKDNLNDPSMPALTKRTKQAKRLKGRQRPDRIGYDEGDMFKSITSEVKKRESKT